jgi:hypothetical protein
MSRILEIQDLDFDGDRLLVRAVVEDAVLGGRALRAIHRNGDLPFALGRSSWTRRP